MLLNGTVNTLDLASSYWSLRGKDVYKHPSDWEGEWIYSAIKSGLYIVFTVKKIDLMPTLITLLSVPVL